MKKKYCMLFLVGCLVFTTASTYAQVYLGGGFGGGYGRFGGGYGVRRRPQQRISREVYPKFQPTVNVSIGYGFPNVDVYQFPDYYTSYKGSASQTGPVTFAIDYRFSRFTSIGVLGTYGKVSLPYYDNYSSTLSQTESLESWSLMLNLMRYMPVSNNTDLYLRGALGANVVNNVTRSDGSGNKLGPDFTPDVFAYQLGVGVRVKMVDDVAFFAEAGYGKYIIHGGLSFSFK